MPKYKVGLNYGCYVNLDVEADSKEQAYEKAKEMEEKLPKEEWMQKLAEDALFDNDCTIIAEVEK